MIDEKDFKNFNDIKGEQFYDSKTKSTYWIYTIPKSMGKLKQGLSDYYETNDLWPGHENHNGDVEQKSLSKKYNAMISLNGSAASPQGFWGRFVLDGKERQDHNNGFYTLGIDDNGDIHHFKPDKEGVSEILNKGIKNVCDFMSPLLINGQEPSDDIKQYELPHWIDIDSRNPRCVLGQNQSKDTYMFLIVNGRRNNEGGMTYTETSRLCKKHGFYNAIASDGGGSSELLIHHHKLNWHIDSTGGKFHSRKRPHILYIESNGVLGALFNEKINTFRDDLNEICMSGIFWAYGDTVNSPSNVSHGILNLQVDDTNKLQIAFPYSIWGDKIKLRRNSGQDMTNWIDILKK